MIGHGPGSGASPAISPLPGSTPTGKERQEMTYWPFV